MRKSQVNLIVVALISLILIGCSANVKQIELKVSPVKPIPLVLPEVDKINLDDIEWFVITKGNAEAVFAELEKKNYDEALFGLTDKGYENISVNMSKILTLVQQQELIIGAYKKYHAKQSGAISQHNKEQSESLERQKKESKKDDSGTSIFKRLLPWGSK